MCKEVRRQLLEAMKKRKGSRWLFYTPFGLFGMFYLEQSMMDKGKDEGEVEEVKRRRE